MTYHVAVVESTPHPVLVLHRTVRPDHAGDDIGAGMQALYTVAATTGMVPSGPPTTTYRGELGPRTSTDVDFALPVTVGPLGIDDDVTVRRTEPGLYARTIHHGDYQAIGAAYRALDAWLRESAFQPMGPPTEVYLVAPDEAVAPHDLLTEIRIPVAHADLTARVAMPVADTIQIVGEALAEQGFGVLTEIDVCATLRTKLDVAMEEYVILGACNPSLAHRALEIDRRIGLLLPCNVVVRAAGDITIVEAMDPEILVRQSGTTELEPIALEARASLLAVMETVGKHSPAT
ncbi:DUF302 domain-containing protein [Nocardia sp. NPDC049190]|uniref:DUF302 domain-containing protein n=1 Tax=Nocardia sp. NPDC049190 TaxID=3155650 RepID=UPI0033E253C7